MAELEEAPQNTKSTTLKGLFETADEYIHHFSVEIIPHIFLK